MKNVAIKLYDEDGNEFIVNKQRVKPYQKDALDFDGNDDVTLEDEEGVTLYLMRRSPRVLRSFTGRLLNDDLASYHIFLLHY
ncbi:hypothetical protein Tco_1225085 [Tanacetum coccineum]